METLGVVSLGAVGLSAGLFGFGGSVELKIVCRVGGGWVCKVGEDWMCRVEGGWIDCSLCGLGNVVCDVLVCWTVWVRRAVRAVIVDIVSCWLREGLSN